MNYFSHGIRYLDRPYFLAGTAVPDMLSVADRKVRVRGRFVEPLLDHVDQRTREIARGVWQHLRDDAWFHERAVFVETCGAVTRCIKTCLGPDDGFRPAFLGHIVTELLLDRCLIVRYPEKLEAYYQALAGIDAFELERAVNSMAKFSTSRLAPLVPLFLKERFLFDYVEYPRLRYRLNQVMRRVKLQCLPVEMEEVLAEAADVVERNAGDLLPDECFA